MDRIHVKMNNVAVRQYSFSGLLGIPMAFGTCAGEVYGIDGRFFAGRFADVVAPMAVVAGSGLQLSGQRGFFMNTILELDGGFRMAILTGEKMILRRPLDIMAPMAVGAG